MNAIDRVVSYFSPRAGLDRVRARAQVAILREHVDRRTARERRYEAASGGRRTDGWVAPNTSANAEARMGLTRLRARVHDLARNNGWAVSMLDAIETQAIGHGITPRPKTDDKTLAAQYREAWAAWAESRDCDADGRHDYYGLQALAMRTIAEAGEVLIRRRWRRAADGFAIPLQLQILEPEHLDETKDGLYSEQSGERTIQGVVFDKLGARVAYWLFRQHPGDIGYAAGYQSVRVPATEVEHVFLSRRPGQVRGIPWLASSALKLRDLDDFDDATLLAQKMQNCFAGFIHDIDGSSANTGLPVDSSGRVIDAIEPGMLEPLPPGKTVEFTKPNAPGNYAEFTRTQLRAIAAGGGASYELLSGDLSQTSFSGGRIGHLAYRRRVDSWVWKMFVPGFCEPTWEWFATAAVLAGKVREVVPAKWAPPPHEMLDPKSEVVASRDAMRIGTSTLFEEIAARGRDPVDTIHEAAEAFELARSLGLSLDSDPNKAANGGTAPAAEENPDDEDPDAKDPDGKPRKAKTPPQRAGAKEV
jgi:lambda family phage portal protein